MVSETQDGTFWRDGVGDFFWMDRSLRILFLHQTDFYFPFRFMPHDRNKAELWRWNLLQTLYMYRTCGEFIKI